MSDNLEEQNTNDFYVESNSPTFVEKKSDTASEHWKFQLRNDYDKSSYQDLGERLSSLDSCSSVTSLSSGIDSAEIKELKQAFERSWGVKHSSPDSSVPQKDN